MDDKNKNLALRIASALVLLPGVIFLLLQGGLWSAVLIGAAAAICAAEYYRITLKHLSPAGWAAVLAAFLLPLYPHLSPQRAGDLALWTIAVFFLLAWSYELIHGPLDQAVIFASHLVTGLLYAALGLTALSALRRGPDGRQWVFCVLIATWGNDTCAYFVGRFLGRHKLYPEVSPHKTWEGLIGGMGGSLVGMLIARATFFPALSIGDCIAVGLATGVVGPIGDLCESMLKRAYHVKDSSQIIPGHGGLLDRIDALIFNAPIVFLYAQFVRPML